MSTPTIDITLADAQPAPELGRDADLATVLEAWQSATDRLQRTHAALRDEVRRLSDELEKKNRELARKNRLADLGLVASHVAHEVRNSLVPMKLYLSLLRRQLAADAASLALADKFTSSLRALESTVSDLLQFTADRQPQRRPFRVRELIDDVRTALAPQFTAQGIDFTVRGLAQGTGAGSVDGGDAASARNDGASNECIDADYDMLRRAMMNLVLNALDVMPQGGRLEIAARNAGGDLELRVRDSGPGLDAEAADRVFEPFFSTKSGGTGLGLVIVARIAEAHGGTVAAENDARGGAAFTLRIPLPRREAA